MLKSSACERPTVVANIIKTVASLLDEDAKIIWGAQIYKDLDKTVRVLLIITGVKSEQIFSPLKRNADKKIQEIEQELGIEFVK